MDEIYARHSVVAGPCLGLAQGIVELKKTICGTHPVIAYLDEYKGILMDPQVLTATSTSTFTETTAASI